MLEHVKRGALIAMLAGMAPLAGAQDMATPLTAPAEVPLDFLRWIKQDPGWLAGAMDAAGVSGGVAVPDVAAKVSTIEALRAINRIRTFAHLAAPGLRPPYFDLMIRGPGDSTFRCVTQFPQAIVAGIGPMDFAAESFAAEKADAVLVDLCRVRPTKGAEYEGLDRETFRSRYFDAGGHLKPDFARLNSDPGFIATAFDLGFFVAQGDVTGRLQVDRP